jgi:16S rRNA (guanine(966)-N(2))-methyltransferase RsmD
MNYTAGAKVLDLFSGTGNLAIEALSRGAEFAVVIDNNPKCARTIEENLIHTKLKDKSKILCSEVLSSISCLNEKFDLIFMDPPYNKGHLLPTLDSIYEKQLLNDDGLIIVERRKNDLIEKTPFKIVREEVYGDTVISFLKY